MRRKKIRSATHIAICFLVAFSGCSSLSNKHVGWFKPIPQSRNIVGRLDDAREKLATSTNRILRPFNASNSKLVDLNTFDDPGREFPDDLENLDSASQSKSSPFLSEVEITASHEMEVTFKYGLFRNRDGSASTEEHIADQSASTTIHLPPGKYRFWTERRDANGKLIRSADHPRVIRNIKHTIKITE